ncbi:hypothetical protein LOD99_10562 [Oopsacas minuta]|uniref:HAT C-terminal dimerisation domain-containing protein n=1 Tax=Oopsacas minuta TaxID=111878 RepID=A0AAV7KFQ9_9METZ|nr:hypothetical protein LOD99_10562 [Oopsacas minuta]
MIRELRKLQQSLLDRYNRGFLGAITDMELANIDNVIQIHKFKSECMTFYQISFDYLDKWLHLDSLPQNLDWLLLKDVELIDYKILKGCAELLCPEIAQIDDLFEEGCCLQRNFPSLSMTSDLSLDQRWGIITQENFPCIRKLLSSIFAILASNAVCERVFSLSKVQWRDDRNKLDISTVGALLKVIVNFEMSCREIHQKLTNNKVALKKICSNAKYTN